MTARFALTVLHFLFAASAFSSSPNILIIYVDDFGYGDTAVYGHPPVRTPNIDQLAKEGFVLLSSTHPQHCVLSLVQGC